jgi:hypothetical protein
MFLSFKLSLSFMFSTKTVHGHLFSLAPGP